jgi:hypothetical protein
MNEKFAREIFDRHKILVIQTNELYLSSYNFICWPAMNDSRISLRGDFDSELLVALSWWMQNKRPRDRTSGGNSSA